MTVGTCVSGGKSWWLENCTQHRRSRQTGVRSDADHAGTDDEIQGLTQRQPLSNFRLLLSPSVLQFIIRRKRVTILFEDYSWCADVVVDVVDLGSRHQTTERTTHWHRLLWAVVGHWVDYRHQACQPHGRGRSTASCISGTSRRLSIKYQVVSWKQHWQYAVVDNIDKYRPKTIAIKTL